MAGIPKDPMILMSYLNTQLRDRYASFAELCAELELDADAVTGKLAAVGFFYDEAQNRFR